jgi:two-component system response regulator NreC
LRDHARSHQWALRRGSPIRVVIADDHAVARRNMRSLLDSEADTHVVAEAGDLFAVLRELDRHAPDVVILDLQMPGGSSIEAIRYLRSYAPATQVVLTTMEPSARFAARALAAGAAGFVLKERADSELADAVREVACNRPYVSPSLAGRLESGARS